VDPKADMPSFGKRLTPSDIDALAQYLTVRR
jgi:mono/diheme cytochrome c family protein